MLAFRYYFWIRAISFFLITGYQNVSASFSNHLIHFYAGRGSISGIYSYTNIYTHSTAHFQNCIIFSALDFFWIRAISFSLITGYQNVSAFFSNHLIHFCAGWRSHFRDLFFYKHLYAFHCSLSKLYKFFRS